MLSSSIQDRFDGSSQGSNQDYEYHAILNFVQFPSTIISKKQRTGPKGGPVERYVGSVEIIDSQDDVIAIEALAKEMDTLIEIGGNFQGVHTNYPAGYIFDWGFCKVKEIDKLGIWIDVEFYTQYQSQRDFYKRTQLPWGHKEKIAGVSLGGKALASNKICDGTKCWNHINKLEAWEWSGVKEPANYFARKITEDGKLEGLNLEVEFLGKNQYLESEDIGMPNNQPRDPTTGQFMSKGDGDCSGCPDDTQINKMECPECGNSMSGAICKGCGYKKMEKADETDKKKKPKDEENLEDEEESGSEEYDEEEEKMDDAKPSSRPAEQTYPEMDVESDETMSGETQLLQELKQNMDTLMSSLNIEKEKNTELQKSLEKRDAQLDALMKKLGVEPDVPQEIEHDGRTYILKTDNDGSAPEENEESGDDEVSALKKEVEILTDTFNDFLKGLGHKEVDTESNLENQDEDINKALQNTPGVLDDPLIKSVQNSQHFDQMSNKDTFYNPNFEPVDLEFQSNLEKSFYKTQPTPDQMGFATLGGNEI